MAKDIIVHTVLAKKVSHLHAIRTIVTFLSIPFSYHLCQLCHRSTIIEMKKEHKLFIVRYCMYLVLVQVDHNFLKSCTWIYTTGLYDISSCSIHIYSYCDLHHVLFVYDLSIDGTRLSTVMGMGMLYILVQRSQISCTGVPKMGCIEFAMTPAALVP